MWRKKIWNSCASLFRFQNIYRRNTRRCSSVLNTKEKTTRFAMELQLICSVVTRIILAIAKTTQFFTARICNLWCCLWRKFKREFYHKTWVLIFPKTAFRKDVRTQNDLSWWRHWCQWASYTHARVVVLKMNDLSNMQTNKTGAHLNRISFGKILWQFISFMMI